MENSLKLFSKLNIKYMMKAQYVHNGMERMVEVFLLCSSQYSSSYFFFICHLAVCVGLRITKAEGCGDLDSRHFMF